MCSQSIDHQDLNPSPCIVGESGLEDTSRENYNQPPNQLSDMGMRYMNIPNEDNRFNSESTSSQSPLYSLEPSIQSATQSSNLGISAYNTYYPPPTQNLSTYSNGHGTGASAYFAPHSLFSSISDNIKPSRLSSLHTSSGYSQSRGSPALSHISPPLSARDLYSSHTPGIRRPSDLLTRSPSFSGPPTAPVPPPPLRSIPISPAPTSDFTSPISNMSETFGTNNPVPPLYATEVHYGLTSSDGQTVRPEIFGRIDKGFFLADNDWTCYRRNYFSLNCSYSLLPMIPNGKIFLQLHGSSPIQVHTFSMSIAAVVDGRDGKPIELVQHTPKRDKGPQEKPARVVLAPRPTGTHVAYDAIGGGRPGIFDNSNFNPTSNQPATEATFERIQFKNATANNGKRRAAQQYYHLLVELFADVGSQHVERYIKIASRMSAPMVVRGRSPGHYHGERRSSSNTSNGPGGSSEGSGGSYSSSGNLSRAPGDYSLGGVTSMLSSTSFGNNYDNRSHNYRSNIPALNIPVESNVSLDEPKQHHIDESSCFMYFPSSVWENGDSRFHLPTREYIASKPKSDSTFSLPSLSYSAQDGSVGLGNRNCGRWNNIAENKGYFPTTLAHQGLNIT